jgi:hypothetical protein
MPQIIRKDGPLAKLLAEVCMIPIERIQHFAVVVQHDRGCVLMHTMCCNDHAREGLARVAATPPDIANIGDYRSEN